MDEIRTTDPEPQSPAPQSPSAARRLMHRWFVEYNPLYLVSAMLVLAGMTLLSNAAAKAGTGEREIGWVPLIAEAYAFALIGGAALLTRIRQRRAATMLGLLVVLYQGDLTLLTERQVHLGAKGTVAAALWLALFVVKILALSRALRLRVSRSFLAIATAGAAGLVILPRVIAEDRGSVGGAVVACWVFVLVAAVIWSRREVSSRVTLDDWQSTVLRRSLTATWTIGGLALALHVWLWCGELEGKPGLLVPAAMLLVTRWIGSEALVWVIAFATTCGLRWIAPETTPVVAGMASVVLALRALTWRTPVAVVANAALAGERYRRGWTSDGSPIRVELHGVIDQGVRARLLGGAAWMAWLAVWTLGATEKVLPPHGVVLDLALAATAIAVAWWTGRIFQAFAAPSLAFVHLVATSAWLWSRSATEWGVSSITVGFVILIASLGVGWRLRERDEAVGDDG